MNFPFSKSYKKIQSRLKIKRIRRRVIRFSLLSINLLVLIIILVVVFYPSAKSSTLTSDNSAPINADNTVSNPLDKVSSVDIALTVSRMSNLPETTAITNQAQSESASINTASANDNVISKPQVVATALKSKADIKSYTTVAGDTISSVANKFGITSDSIKMVKWFEWRSFKSRNKAHYSP
jgi:LysM repeat protein